MGLIPSWGTKLPASHTVQPKACMLLCLSNEALGLKGKRVRDKSRELTTREGQTIRLPLFNLYAKPFFLIFLQNLLKNKICRNTPDKNR